MLKIAWSQDYIFKLPEGHRFPMEKYQLIPEQLLYEGTIEVSNLFTAPPIEEEILLQTHTAEYWVKLKYGKLSPSEIRVIGFPFSDQLVHRERIITEGTRMAALYALEDGISMNIAGGTHHAFRERGEGFCIFNDQAVAANWLLQKYVVSKILIIDLDVHQGNGTAKIFENNSSVFTFSMHGTSNYPGRKEKSDKDLGLPDNLKDDAYLFLLKENIPELIEKEKPELIFYQAGVDVLETDKLGKLSLSKEGCKERDRYILQQCKLNNIPVVITMGGGYSERLADIVDAHCNTFRVAQEMYF